MKQVSNAFTSFVLSSPRHHSIPQRKAFSKFLSVLLLAGIALFNSSCQKEELQGNLQRQELQVNSQKQDHKNNCVPFKGKFTTSFTETGVVGTGTASNIGKFTLVTQDDDSNFPDITGNVIITAANGDQIFATHTGSAQELSNGMLQVNFVNTITGGSGRYIGTIGSFDIHALVDESTGVGNDTLDGTICF